MSWLASLFIFALVWSLGALVDGNGRVKFDEFYRQLITGHDQSHPKPKHLKIGKVCVIYVCLKSIYNGTG